MGISDRQYMGDSEGSFGSFRGRPLSAVLFLLLLNIVVWIAWQLAWHDLRARAFMFDNFTVSPTGVLEHYRVWTLFTYSISHVDAMHILFNMLFLWFLGGDVEVFYGRKNFVALYVFAAVISAVAQCGLEWGRGRGNIPSLGASGSVMGIVVAAAFIDPRKQLYIWMVPVQLWLLAIIYVAIDLSGVMRDGDRIGHAAHLGGAFSGFLFYKLDLRIFASRGRRSSGMLYRLSQWWRGRKFRVIEGGKRRPREIPPDDRELVATRRPRGKRAAGSERPVITEATERIDPETARRVDELLSKISREGMDALSSEEQEFLKQSSRKYRK
jgi:membrane associated rhomboid family serine protease